MIKVGIVGLGYWGPNLVRNFQSVNGAEVHSVADFDNNRLQKIHQLYPKINLCNDANEIFENPEIDAVVLATSINTHYDLAKKAKLESCTIGYQKYLNLPPIHLPFFV